MPDALPLNHELEQAAKAVIEAVRTEQPERALVRVRFLLAKYGNDTVNKLVGLLQADAYLECERIAKSLGASDVAREIRETGKLDEIHVTECKSEDIRG